MKIEVSYLHNKATLTRNLPTESILLTVFQCASLEDFVPHLWCIVQKDGYATSLSIGILHHRRCRERQCFRRTWNGLRNQWSKTPHAIHEAIISPEIIIFSIQRIYRNLLSFAFNIIIPCLGTWSLLPGLWGDYAIAVTTVDIPGI